MKKQLLNGEYIFNRKKKMENIYSVFSYPRSKMNQSTIITTGRNQNKEIRVRPNGYVAKTLDSSDVPHPRNQNRE